LRARAKLQEDRSTAGADIDRAADLIEVDKSAVVRSDCGARAVEDTEIRPSQNINNASLMNKNAIGVRSALREGDIRDFPLRVVADQ
jgi:hypothetical protein